MSVLATSAAKAAEVFLSTRGGRLVGRRTQPTVNTPSWGTLRPFLLPPSFSSLPLAASWLLLNHNVQLGFLALR